MKRTIELLWMAQSAPLGSGPVSQRVLHTPALKLIHIYPSVHPSSYLLSPSVSMLIPVSLLIHFSPFLLFQDIQYITSECVLISIGK